MIHSSHKKKMILIEFHTLLVTTTILPSLIYLIHVIQKWDIFQVPIRLIAWATQPGFPIYQENLQNEKTPGKIMEYWKKI